MTKFLDFERPIAELENKIEYTLYELDKNEEIQKQIMDTVLYKLNDYKRQQGVIS